MTQTKLIFKSIEKWAQRPGVVATATILYENEPNGPVEMDIFSKQYAIDITLDLISTLTILIKHHEDMLMEVVPKIREYLWNSDKEKFIYNSSPEELNTARKEHERLLLSYYPIRSMIGSLSQMKKDRDRYEKLFIYFYSL